MIPKKIHYCWFGGNQLNELALKCIESWKKYCPDYEIIEWNESNFDINCNEYVKEAYEAKRWAFVTDYVRLYVLYNYGGIYMDTDAELLKNIDCFLTNPAFSGFENNKEVPTAIMGAECGNKWIELLLDDYNGRHFLKSDGSYDITTNVATITRLTAENYEVTLDNTFTEVDGVVVFYPSDYFCPKDWFTGRIDLTENTYCIHHFNSSWFTEKDRLAKKELEHIAEIRKRYIEKYGEKNGERIIKVWDNIRKVKRVLRESGVGAVFAVIRRKLVSKFSRKA